MVLAMMFAEDAGKRMMQEYFELEASQATPMYNFRKGLAIFGNEGYQATIKELETNLIGRVCIEMLGSEEVSWDIRKNALSYLMFFKKEALLNIESQRMCRWSSTTRVYI